MNDLATGTNHHGRPFLNQFPPIPTIPLQEPPVIMRILTLALTLSILAPAPLSGQDSRPRSRPGSRPATTGPASRASHSRPARRNRLARSKSPYLRQHADNPVDWWPWCEEAFAEARKRDVPVFLSIGYSTCHWCHVMAHESFEDDATARYMNEHFVCIKLDREERPDVDALYMQYVIRITRGGGGWPASIWMTADKLPFHAGTYFPKEPRFGRMSFRQMLEAIVDVWKTRRDEVQRAGKGALGMLRSLSRAKPSKDLPDADLLERCAAGFLSRHDRVFGGFRDRGPKFPSTTTHEILFASAVLNGKKKQSEAALHSLKAMARGGIHDHVGGGFHRYSTDERWLVPHFEKMLYDQARIAVAYLEAFVVSGDAMHESVVRDVLECLVRDFRNPEGAFMSAYDADSGGVEGSFYVWTEDELRRVLPADQLALVSSRFSISKEGNWEELPGANILAVRKPWKSVASELKLEPGEARRSWNRAREILRTVRGKRAWPGLDDKVITGWNGLALSAFARAGRVLGEERYTRQARTVAGYVQQRLTRKDGSLFRRLAGGEPAFDAVLEDYAYVIQGLIDLWETTGELQWLSAASAHARRMDDLFSDPAGGWFDAPSTALDVIVRHKDIYDGAIPAANGYAARALLRLAALTGDESFRKHALGCLRAFKDQAEREPLTSPTLAHANLLARSGPREIVIVGDPDWPTTRELRDVVRAMLLPDAVLCLVSDAQARIAGKHVPLLAARSSRKGAAVAWVCRGGVCKAPVTTAAGLRAALAK